MASERQTRSESVGDRPRGGKPEQCPTCRGTGQVAQLTCLDCNGKGWYRTVYQER